MQLHASTIEYYIDHWWPIVVAVSGWPDSMCVMTLITDYILHKWGSLNNIHIAHYNHWLRKQSEDEMKLIAKVFEDSQLHIWHYHWSSTSERDLRIVRHSFFQWVMDEVGSNILITGHNLTDRIETSLMNMKRWCQMRWFINMKNIEINHKLSSDWTTTPNKIILRPLLTYHKQEIQHYCDEKLIPYMIDESNHDASVSIRNQFRHEIVMKLNSQQLQNRQTLYTRLEQSQTHYDYPTRNDEKQWYDLGAVGERSLEYLAQIFDWSGCYADMTQGRLLEWQQWIATSYQGEKFVGWRRWWIIQKRVFIKSI